MATLSSPEPDSGEQKSTNSPREPAAKRRNVLGWLARVGGVSATFAGIAFGVGQCNASRAAQREKDAQLGTVLVEKVTNDPKARSDAARAMVRETSPEAAAVLDQEHTPLGATKHIPVAIDEFAAIDSAMIGIVPDSINVRVQQQRQTLHVDSSSVQIATTPITRDPVSSTTVHRDSAGRPVVIERRVGGLYRVGPVFRCGGICEPGQACCAVEAVYTPQQ